MVKKAPPAIPAPRTTPAPGGMAPQYSERRRLDRSKYAIASVCVAMLSMLAVVIPLALDYLNNERYACWVTVETVVLGIVAIVLGLKGTGRHTRQKFAAYFGMFAAVVCMVASGWVLYTVQTRAQEALRVEQAPRWELANEVKNGLMHFVDSKRWPDNISEVGKGDQFVWFLDDLPFNDDEAKLADQIIIALSADADPAKDIPHIAIYADLHVAELKNYTADFIASNAARARLRLPPANYIGKKKQP
jgi:hypothetical protein